MARGKLKILILALALVAVPPMALAQGTRGAKPAKATRRTPKVQAEPLVVSRAGEASAGVGDHNALLKATETYKSSLRDLLVLREQRVKGATGELENLRELYRDGIISRQKFQESEQALVELQGQVAEVHQKLKAADQMLAEAILEAELVNAPPATTAPVAAKSSLKRVSYIRYAGSGNWSLSDAAKIEGFFFTRFGRHLPVSAYGQSELHNRWGYDHRNAMDVAVHPDSTEGQSLMAYLSSQRIPFLAFRQAVQGSATGPHIHIGRPSSKSGWTQY